MLKPFQLTIGNYLIRFSPNARQSLTHFRRHQTDCGYHFVWFRFSIIIEDTTAEVFPTCAVCGSGSIGEVHAGDESFTVCRDCGSVEQGYKYVNLLDYEAANCVD